MKRRMMFGEVVNSCQVSSCASEHNKRLFSLQWHNKLPLFRVKIGFKLHVSWLKKFKKRRHRKGINCKDLDNQEVLSQYCNRLENWAKQTSTPGGARLALRKRQPACLVKPHYQEVFFLDTFAFVLCYSERESLITATFPAAPLMTNSRAV